MDSSAPTTLRPLLPRLLTATGLLTFPAGLGAMLGYYAADRGMRWVPTMVGWVALLCFVGFGALGAGQLMKARDSRGPRRRSALGIASLLLAALCLAGRLALIWVAQPSPLTSLTPQQFNAAFELDSKRFEELSGGLDRVLRYVEQEPGLGREAGVLSADQEQQLIDAWEGVYNHAFSLDHIRRLYEDWYRFDASRLQRSYHLRSFLLTFAAELTLFERGARLVKRLRTNTNVAKYLDAPHAERGLPAGSLSLFEQQLLGVRDQSRVVAGKRYLRWLEKGLDGRSEAAGLGCGWLWERVESKLRRIEAASLIEKAAIGMAADLQPLRRTLKRAWYPAASRVAEWMGDTRVRRVGRYLVKEAQLRPLLEELKPGDILLSRKNWYLSNVGLPGFWPHAILYIGDSGQLRRTFEVEEVRRHLEPDAETPRGLAQLLEARWPARWKRYLKGEGGHPYRVIEAVSEGVVLNTLEHAAGDYLVALRPRLPLAVKARAVLRAFGHLGKPYDFDFDFATEHALVCTELVWRSYRPAEGRPGLRLPLSTMLGRKTLPANEIARVYAEGFGKASAQFDLVGFIDANEEQGRAFRSTEQAFRASHRRTKWDIALK